MKDKFVIFLIAFAFPSIAFSQIHFFNDYSSLNDGTEQKSMQAQNSPSQDVHISFPEFHNSDVIDIQCSSDGKFIMTADVGIIKIWDVATGALIRTIYRKHHTYLNNIHYLSSYTQFSDALFSPDGKFCVYVSEDDKIEVCDIATGDVKILDDKTYAEKGRAMAFSSDGSMFAVAALNTTRVDDKKNYNEIIIYNAETLEPFLTLHPYSIIWNMTFTADSRALVFATNRGGQIIELRQKKTSTALFDFDARLITVSPNNKYVACYSQHYINNPNERKISILDLRTGAKITELSIDKNTPNVKKIYFSRDENKLYYSDITTIYVYHFLKKTVEKIEYVRGTRAQPRCFSFLPNGEMIVCFSNGEIGTWVASEKKRILVKGFSAGERNASYDTRFYYDAEMDSIVTGQQGGLDVESFFRFDRDGNGSFAATKPHFIDVGEQKIRIAESIYASIGGIWRKKDGYVYLFDYSNFNSYKRRLKIDDDKVFRLSGYSNSEIIAVKDTDKNTTVYDVNNQKKLLSAKQMSSLHNDDFLSPNRNFIYSSDSLKNKTQIIHISTKKKINIKGVACRFSNNDKFCAVITKKKNGICYIIVYNTSDWSVASELDKFASDSFCISNNGKYIVFREVLNHNYEMYDLESGKRVLVFPKDMSYTQICFNKDDSKIISMSPSGSFRFFSAQDGSFLSGMLTNADGDWVTYTSEDYFNGNAGGIKNLVYLINGMEVVGLEQVAETFFRPDLVAAKLRGEDISEETDTTSLADVISTGEAPSVQFKNIPTSVNNRDITVNFSVQDMGGGIGAVYVKLNGKVIQLADASRKLELVGENMNITQQQGGKVAQFSHLLTLQNGENTIEAYATNAAGKIESRHAATKITWQGATAKPNLYVLSVGVNKYRDRSLWLNYSVPDAQSISQSFGGHKTSLYQNIFTYELLDENVTKEKLALQFKELSPKVGADDVFVLFIAGHGTTNQKTGDYYFIPSNFRYTDSEAILAQGISKTDILGYMSGIRAEKTLIMLDTCNSGAFTNDAVQRGFAEKTALERLVRATGQAVLTAASEEQSAMEGYEGHGVFTYVLLEALQGKADKNADGYTTLNELAAYIEEQVPELSYQKWGYEQVPMKELKKQDFPLVGK